MNELRVIYEIMMRELKILRQNHIYRFCMVLFPVLVIFFFTSIMDEGLPADMPVGVVDLDNTSTSRSLTRRLDGFQMSRVVARYPSVTEARRAVQRNEIYGFLYIPKGTTEKLLASRQPKISYYYTYTTLVHDVGSGLDGDEGHENHLDPWLCCCRAGNHESPWIDRQADTGHAATHQD